MTCLRCQGLMVEDHFLDLEGAYGEMWTTSFRCMNCGYIHDSVIAQHRQVCQKHVLAHTASDSNYQKAETHFGAEQFTRRAA